MSSVSNESAESMGRDVRVTTSPKSTMEEGINTTDIGDTKVPDTGPGIDTYTVPCSILLVDDIPINLRVTGKLLEKMGITYHTCSSGEDAVKICERYTYKLILMDYYMPGCSGLEASKNIRMGVMNRDTRIVILTASEYDEDITKNGFGYIQKPVTRDSLLGVVDVQMDRTE